ncbi:hypothetical protein [uncultured Endozoicomonas sp.]|uniref:hypothetical protein n=1 Tax=uncultured Endozoicomonas sp. TaxID=432652 RepID=UPI00263A044C|nr:hypothetical protein [uncultured Endozoicomonas sp.]
MDLTVGQGSFAQADHIKHQQKEIKRPAVFSDKSVHITKSECFISRAAKAVAHGANVAVKALVSLLSRMISVVLSPVIWLVENRLGIAKLLGRRLLPSQSREAVDATALVNSKQKTGGNRFEVMDVVDGSTRLKAIICYPPGWDKSQDSISRCAIFNNGNDMCVDDSFDKNGDLDKRSLPGYLQHECQCPVVLYDYNGAGINKSSSSPMATKATIERDGLAVLKHVQSKFDKVIEAGTSLGGGVATTSLEKLLSTHKDVRVDRFQLINHDSFTTTARVAMPGYPRLADALGGLLGINLNAKHSIKKLAGQDVSMMVLNNQNDYCIPQGARMSEFAKELKSKQCCTIEDPHGTGHCHLTERFQQALRAKN